MFKWERNGLTFKGMRKVFAKKKDTEPAKRKRKTKALKNTRIECHKRKCKYYFTATCPFEYGEEGFWDADNWSTAKSNKKAKNHPHALIESDEAKLKAAHPDLVTKSNAPCNVPSEKFELLKGVSYS